MRYCLYVTGNFVTDIMLKGTHADIAMLNSGTLRSDTLHPRGKFKMKDLLSMLPMSDPLVVIQIKGKNHSFTIILFQIICLKKL